MPVRGSLNVLLSYGHYDIPSEDLQKWSPNPKSTTLGVQGIGPMRSRASGVGFGDLRFKGRQGLKTYDLAGMRG